MTAGWRAAASMHGIALTADGGNSWFTAIRGASAPASTEFQFGSGDTSTALMHALRADVAGLGVAVQSVLVDENGRAYRVTRLPETQSPIEVVYEVAL